MKQRHVVLWLLVLVAAGCSQEQPPHAVREEPAVTAESEENLARETPDAGGIERVRVTATGEGSTRDIAVSRAIRLAFEQVNGKSFDALSVGVEAGLAGQWGERPISGSVAGYADAIMSRTKGAVSDFRLLSEEPTEAGVRVSIEASVRKYVQPESAGKLRVAIAPLRSDQSSFRVGEASVSASEVAKRISGVISEVLLASGRTTLLDREFDAELRTELGRIDPDDYRNGDHVRLGQQLAADYLVVGEIQRFGYEKQERRLRMSDRTLVSFSGGGSLRVQVINAATGQIELFETLETALPATAPTSMPGPVDVEGTVLRLIDGLADPAARGIRLSLFPVTVVDVDGDNVVLSQGEGAVEKGAVYQIVLRGREVTDPQTGQVIGRIERACCTVRVTGVTPEMAYGIIEARQIDDVGAVMAPGALELKDAVAPPVSAPVSAQPAKAPAPETAERTVTTPEDESRSFSMTKANGEGLPEADEDPDW